jgi:hypothetical protein
MLWKLYCGCGAEISKGGWLTKRTIILAYQYLFMFGFCTFVIRPIAVVALYKC